MQPPRNMKKIVRTILSKIKSILKALVSYCKRVWSEINRESITYDNITLKEFYLCTKDPEYLKRKGIDPDDFLEIQIAWENRHPDESNEFYLFKDLDKHTKRLNKYRIMLFRCKMFPNDLQSVFDAINEPVPDNPIEYLERLIERQERNIRRKTETVNKILEHSNKEQVDAGESGLQHLRTSIASMEPFGYTILDYDNLLLSRYDAITQSIKNGQKGSN